MGTCSSIEKKVDIATSPTSKAAPVVAAASTPELPKAAPKKTEEEKAESAPAVDAPIEPEKPAEKEEAPDAAGEDLDNPMVKLHRKASKPWDLTEDTHVIMSKVCDFICGAESPPAPPLHDYMEHGLAVSMKTYQTQMFAEVRRGGLEDNEADYLHQPELCDFWELDRLYPSSENATLRVVSAKFLAVCRKTGKGVICSINIYCDHEVSTGFTLDAVKSIDDQYITQAHKDKAAERYQYRIDNPSTVADEDSWQQHLQDKDWAHNDMALDTESALQAITEGTISQITEEAAERKAKHGKTEEDYDAASPRTRSSTMVTQSPGSSTIMPEPPIAASF